jgi:hypothetical protein
VPLAKPKAADVAPTPVGAPVSPADTTSHTPVSSTTSTSGTGDSSGDAGSGGLAAPNDGADDGAGQGKGPTPRAPSSSTPSLISPHTATGSPATLLSTTSGGSGSGAAEPKR